MAYACVGMVSRIMFHYKCLNIITAGKAVTLQFGSMPLDLFLMRSLALPGQLREAGRKIMANSTLAICGLARDCAQNLEQLIPRIEALGAAFRSYRVIVVENDSADGTGALVSSWQKENGFVRAIRFCYLGAGHLSDETMNMNDGQVWFGEDRIRRIANARNLYLEELASEALPDYVLMIDLDIRSFSQPGIENCFGLVDDWDVITANGKRYSKRHPLRRSVYWDSYAYEPMCGFIDGIQTPSQIRNYQLQVSKLLAQNTLLPAKSAFGGLGIYRASLLAKNRYSAQKNGDASVPVLCEHHALHRAIRNQAGDLRLFINPFLTVDYGSILHLARYSIRAAIGK